MSGFFFLPDKELLNSHTLSFEKIILTYFALLSQTPLGGPGYKLICPNGSLISYRIFQSVTFLSFVC